MNSRGHFPITTLTSQCVVEKHLLHLEAPIDLKPRLAPNVVSLVITRSGNAYILTLVPM